MTPDLTARLTWEEEIRASLAASAVPSHLHDGLLAYVLEHRPCGAYLGAVLAGDLFGAVRRADPESLAGLSATVAWIIGYAPAVAVGSQNAVALWGGA